MVSARSLSATAATGGGGFGGGNSARVEAAGQFRIENLLPGSYEVRLTGSLGGGPGGGRGPGGGQGRGGQGGAAGQQQPRLPDVRQTVTVTAATPANITLPLNLAQ